MFLFPSDLFNGQCVHDNIPHFGEILLNSQAFLSVKQKVSKGGLLNLCKIKILLLLQMAPL